jgi:hypothetical protein
LPNWSIGALIPESRSARQYLGLPGRRTQCGRQTLQTSTTPFANACEMWQFPGGEELKAPWRYNT